MSQKCKLILGTANFGVKGYNGVQIPLTLINHLLDRARKGGIEILEGSELYHCDINLSQLSFELIYKVKHPYNLNKALENTGRTSFLGLLYHHGLETKAVRMKEDRRVNYLGASIYHRGQLNGSEEMVEVPLNLENREFERFEAPCKIVRNVFGRGELLKKYTVKECLDFVKNNPTVHGVIVGVDNVAQLEEILTAWNGD